MDCLAVKDLSVLLVEPSSTQQLIYQQALRNSGVQKIQVLGTGRKALEEAIKYRPDLVISSLYLPDMTGAELLETLRQEQHTASVPFMLISSETKFQALDPVMQAGAVAILPKPFDQAQLDTAIYAVLDQLEPEQRVSNHVDLSDIRVLLADDSQLAREHMLRLFDAIGIKHIAVVTDGQQAIEQLEKEHFDIVVSDYNMPNVDGRALTEHIRTKSQQPCVPVLMVTSEGNQQRLTALQAAGVSAICRKPFDLRSIKQLIEQLVG